MYSSHPTQPHPFRQKADLSHFWVICVISNPVRYQRRFELYWKFRKMCEEAGVNMVIVEQIFGDRPEAVTDARNPNHVQIRSVDELWHKENMINIGVRRASALDPQIREIAWIDADCRPTVPAREWFEETWHQLQHYHFVQMWEHLIDMDIHNNPVGAPQPSFMSNYLKYGTPNPEKVKQLQEQDYYGSKIFGRPGLAWACDIYGWRAVAELLQGCILGAADWYQAFCLIGAANLIVGDHIGTKAYQASILRWQQRCERWVKRDVGFVPGTVLHDFHGSKKNRGYGTRGEILVKNKYNPYTDIKVDQHGLLQLETWEPRQIRLRDEIRAYFRSRSEDEHP